MTPPSINIIGAGYSGLAAAYEFVKAGWQVDVFEEDSEVGGLAGSFELSPGYFVERFYHHWFTNDVAALDFVKELGIGDRIQYLPTNTGLYYANSIFRLASPFDLLKFTPIPFLDRIRTGLMALYARRIEDYRTLEGMSAKEWLIKVGGRKGYEVIWQPLLQGKFGPEAENVSAVWFWNKLKLRGSSRGSKGAETLAYLKGGFRALTLAIQQALEGMGVRFHMRTRAEKILTEGGKVAGVVANGTKYPAPYALATTPIPITLELCPDLPAEYRARLAQIRYLGNVCLVLRLKRSLSSTYWLNVADPTFPFVGVIEHTNLDDPANYGGERVAYLSKYLPTSDPMYAMSEEELFRFCVPFVQRIFPEFDASWVTGYRGWRAAYSQPVITQHYSKLRPEPRTPLPGLWLSTMAQVYPEDRGTNYAIQYSRRIAKELMQYAQDHR